MPPFSWEWPAFRIDEPFLFRLSLRRCRQLKRWGRKKPQTVRVTLKRWIGHGPHCRQPPTVNDEAAAREALWREAINFGLRIDEISLKEWQQRDLYSYWTAKLTLS